MILKLQAKYQFNAHILTIEDLAWFAQILFSFDEPVALQIKNEYAVLAKKQRTRRTMTTHIDHWVPHGMRVKELSVLELDEAIRRLMLMVEKPDEVKRIVTSPAIEKAAEATTVHASTPPDTPLVVPAADDAGCAVCGKLLQYCSCTGSRIIPPTLSTNAPSAS